MPLTVAKIKNTKPSEKPVRLADGRGLYLEIAPSGGKLWRWKYRFGGKEKRLSLGVYTSAGSNTVEVNLEQARKLAEDARRLVREGVDPSQARKAEKLEKAQQSENTFEAVTREWHSKKSPTWAPEHATRVLRRMELHLFPFIGNRPIAEIEAPELLGALRHVEARDTVATAHLCRQYCGMAFRYGIATGRCRRDPAADLRGALAGAPESHFPAVTEPKKFGELLRMMYGYEGTATVRAAMRLAPLLVVRPGELRRAEWKDFDLDGAEWRYVASKTHPDHIVPLSKQAVRVLRELHPVTGSGRFVFPSARSASRPMSDAAVNAAMRRMGTPADQAVGHGFRASFRTLGDEVLKFRVDLIEHQLAHMVKDPNGRAYNRTSFLVDRKRMMQKWSDYCDRLKDANESNVVVFGAA
jgi:integrase